MGLNRLAAIALGSAALLAGGAIAQGFDMQSPVLMSLDMNGAPTGGVCAGPRFSPNGQYLAFQCASGDIVPGDGNDSTDVFWMDLRGSGVERISVTSQGLEMPYHSFAGRPADDGDRVVFTGLGKLHPDAALTPAWFDHGLDNGFLRRRGVGTTDLINRDAAGHPLTAPSTISDAWFPGNELLFAYTGNLFLGPDTDYTMGQQLWIRNWVTGTLELITAKPSGQISEGGGYSPKFSASGRYVLFRYSGDDLGPSARRGDLNVYLRDREVGTTTRLTYPRQGGEFVGLLSTGPYGGISADARYVVFDSSSAEIHPEGNADGGTYVYLLDRQSGSVELISRNPGGAVYPSFNTYADISDDGRYIAWAARTFVGITPNGDADQRAIWVLDRQTGERVNVTRPLGPLYREAGISLDLSADGSQITFSWRSGDPAQPSTFNRSLIYRVQLRQPDAPYAEPVPVPLGAFRWLALLAALTAAFGSLLLAQTRLTNRPF